MSWCFTLIGWGQLKKKVILIITFVGDGQRAVEVLLLQRPRRIVHLAGDPTWALTVHLDGCGKRRGKKYKSTVVKLPLCFLAAAAWRGKLKRRRGSANIVRSCGRGAIFVSCGEEVGSGLVKDRSLLCYFRHSSSRLFNFGKKEKK